MTAVIATTGAVSHLYIRSPIEQTRSEQILASFASNSANPPSGPVMIAQEEISAFLSGVGSAEDCAAVCASLWGKRGYVFG